MQVLNPIKGTRRRCVCACVCVILKFGAKDFQIANLNSLLILLNTFSGSNVQTLPQHHPRSLQQKEEQRRHSRDVRTTINHPRASIHSFLRTEAKETGGVRPGKPDDEGEREQDNISSSEVAPLPPDPLLIGLASKESLQEGINLPIVESLCLLTPAP